MLKYEKSVKRLYLLFIELLFSFKRSWRILRYLLFKKSPSFPVIFQIQTTNLCNGSCIMCPLSTNQSKQNIKMPDKLSSQIEVLLEVYDQAYNIRAWHGTNLRGALKGLKLTELLWRPQSNRHNIWEITLQCAYWKYIVYRRLSDKKVDEFWRTPSDWPKYPDSPKILDWKNDLDFLEDYHLKLRNTISSFNKERLRLCPEKSEVNYIQTIYGAASHDLYHAGQIQLIKRMARAE